ncbi:MAG: c-type cytochrome [Bacteroidota bacterium]|nr:c-type cytochrome [Bacteroidota bacterium]
MKAKKFKEFFYYSISVFVISSLLIGCGKENKTDETGGKNIKTDTSKKTSTTSGRDSPGKEIFYKKSADNNIACADCHSDGTNNGNPLTKYFSNIQGANKRVSTYHGMFKGEDVVNNAGGATVCWESYLRMKTPLTKEQISALNDYYASVAGSGSAAEMMYETIALPTRDKTKLKDAQKIVMDLKGDAVKGEQGFNNACGFCHAENATVKKVPSILEDFEGNVKSIVYNARLGDGAMPFFKTQSLSDQEVADISAYIMQKSGK